MAVIFMPVIFIKRPLLAVTTAGLVWWQRLHKGTLTDPQDLCRNWCQ